jgi:hypothetical protein
MNYIILIIYFVYLFCLFILFIYFAQTFHYIVLLSINAIVFWPLFSMYISQMFSWFFDYIPDNTCVLELFSIYKAYSITKY